MGIQESRGYVNQIRPEKKWHCPTGDVISSFGLGPPILFISLPKTDAFFIENMIGFTIGAAINI